MTTTDDIQKSEFPYLVDISITSKCGENCAFCYADSKEDGKDSDPYWVGHALRNVLEEANVFEVVFGGGEPAPREPYSKTLNLSSIIEDYQKSGFKTSFTTRNFNLDKLEKFGTIVSNVNAIAFSCHSPEDVKKLEPLAKKIQEEYSRKTHCHWNVPKIVVQHILGTCPWKKTKEIMETASETAGVDQVTLLGFKTVGRGNSFKPFPVNEDWISLSKKSTVPVGVDSVLARDWKKQLLQAGVTDYTLCAAEGKSSCYIDAVNKQIRPSSFSDEVFDIPDNFNAKNFLEIFSSF